MTDLTEQWKRNQLVDDECYYVRTDCGSCYTVTGESIACEDYIDGCKIVEVLAKVPSYEELQQINESVKKMKDVVLNTEMNSMKSIIEIVNTAKENSQLKKQLAIAVECMREYLRGGCYPLMEKKLKEIEELDE